MSDPGVAKECVPPSFARTESEGSYTHSIDSPMGYLSESEAELSLAEGGREEEDAGGGETDMEARRKM